MRQRGRKSAAALTVIPVEGKPNRASTAAVLERRRAKSVCRPRHRLRASALPTCGFALAGSVC
jgi:hypothetical protein